MAIRSYKPTSPGRRFVTGSDYSEVTATRPHKKLTQGIKRSSGRTVTATSPPDIAEEATNGSTGSSTSGETSSRSLEKSSQSSTIRIVLH